MGVITLLVLLIATLAYKLIVPGRTDGTIDGRTVVLLEPAERIFVLGEMRGLLAGVQQISEALANDDVARVAKIARSLGLQADTGAPPGLMSKLPLEFKKLGLSVHTDFDAIANNAGAGTAPKELLRQMSGLMQKCIACHNAYQFNHPLTSSRARAIPLAARSN